MSTPRQPNQSLSKRMQAQHEERKKQAELARSEADKRRNQDTTAAAKAAAELVRSTSTQSSSPSGSQSFSSAKSASQSVGNLGAIDQYLRTKQSNSAPSVATAAYQAAQTIGKASSKSGSDTSQSTSKSSAKSLPIVNVTNRLGANGLPIPRVELQPAQKTPESQSATAASMLAFKRKQKQDQEEKERLDREQKAQEQMYALQEKLFQEHHANRVHSPHSFLSIPHFDTESDLSDAMSTNSQEKRRSISRNRQSPFATFSSDLSSPEYTQQFISDAARIAANKQNTDESDKNSLSRSSFVENASNSRASVDDPSHNGANALAAAVAAKSNVEDAVEKINNVIGASRDNNFARYQPAATWTGFHSTTLRSRKRDDSSGDREHVRSRERSEPPESRNTSSENHLPDSFDDSPLLSDEAIEHQRKFLQERSKSVDSASGRSKKKKTGLRSKLDFISKLSGSKEQPNDKKEHALLSTMRSTKHKNFNEDKPWKHHRNALVVTEKEKKRYEGVWAANKGLQVPFLLFEGDEDASDDSESDESDDSDFYYEGDEIDGSVTPSLGMAMEEVHGIVVRELWRRSRIADSALENIWNLVDRTQNGGLGRDEFLVGMWLVDQCLYGRKMPTKIDSQVWNSVARLNLEIRVKNKKDGHNGKSQRKKKKKNRRNLVVVHPAHV